MNEKAKYMISRLRKCKSIYPYPMKKKGDVAKWSKSLVSYLMNTLPNN